VGVVELCDCERDDRKLNGLCDVCDCGVCAVTLKYFLVSLPLANNDSGGGPIMLENTIQLIML